MLSQNASLLYKIDTPLQKPTTCIGRLADKIFTREIQYIFFSVLGVNFVAPFLYFFQKLQLLAIKKFRNNFCALFFYLYELKMCLRFLKSYFRLEILKVCPCWCLFQQMCLTKNLFFCRKPTSDFCNLGQAFVENLSKFNVGKY